MKSGRYYLVPVSQVASDAKGNVDEKFEPLRAYQVYNLRLTMVDSGLSIGAPFANSDLYSYSIGGTMGSTTGDTGFVVGKTEN